MQDDLFGDTLPKPPPAEAAASARASRIVPGTDAPTRRSRSGTVALIAPDGALTALAAYDLEYAEQPCRTVAELARLRVEPPGVFAC